ncbi:hypothetical protein [Gymnodinialimonas hymeniacidonis]
MKPVALIAAILAVCTLAACGVDGEPEQPDRASTGISVSGSVSIGIAGRN